MIEKLTNEDRATLEEIHEGCVALDIIDQLTAKLEEWPKLADVAVEHYKAECERLRAALTDECSLRVQATDAAHDLQTRLAAANALLERAPIPDPDGEGPTNADVALAFEVLDQLRAYLAGQAAPTSSSNI